MTLSKYDTHSIPTYRAVLQIATAFGSWPLFPGSLAPPRATIAAGVIVPKLCLLLIPNPLLSQSDQLTS